VNRLACRVMAAVAGMAVLGMTATLAGAQTHPATFTLNDVMQAPFASDMLAAPTGTAVAWVFNAKGCSNIAPSPAELAAVLSVEPAEVNQVFLARAGVPFCFAQLTSYEVVGRR